MRFAKLDLRSRGTITIGMLIITAFAPLCVNIA
jgi:hypothetical protein